MLFLLYLFPAKSCDTIILFALSLRYFCWTYSLQSLVTQLFYLYHHFYYTQSLQVLILSIFFLFLFLLTSSSISLHILKRIDIIFPFFFFNWDSLHARLNSHCEAWSYKKGSTKKRLQDTENLFRKNLQLKNVC